MFAFVRSTTSAKSLERLTVNVCKKSKVVISELSIIDNDKLTEIIIDYNTIANDIIDHNQLS